MSKVLRSPVAASLLIACLLLLGVTSTVLATVWTDQADYMPGSTVTLSGDNSNGAGYVAGELVDVAVAGPNGYAQSCVATANEAGAWSCQVVLNNDSSAIGDYSYTATGQSSGVQENGTFSDGPKISSVTVDPEIRYVFAGGTAQYQATVNRDDPGILGNDDFDACLFISFTGGTPAGVTSSWGTNPLVFTQFVRNLSSALSIATTTATPAGSYPFTVTAARKNNNDPCPSTLPNNFNDNASDTGTLVVYAPLNVTKTAAPAVTRTYAWSIDKTVVSPTPATLTLAINETDNANYNVLVTTSSTDSAWQVTGAITIQNDNALDFAASVSDAVNNGGTCFVAGTASATVNVPQQSSVTVNYTCTYSSAPSPSAGTNTATVTVTLAGTDYSFTGTKTFDFATPTTINATDECITVTDDQYAAQHSGSALGTVCADAAPKDFAYTLTVGPYTAAGDYTFTNKACYATNDTQASGCDSASVAVTVLPNQWFSEVTDSSQCIFDRDPNVAGRQFNLIFTQDPTNVSVYKITSTNPGQFYYNVYYYAAAATTLTINIPAPFVTHGAMPVHFYDGVTQNSGCYTNGNLLGSQASLITGVNGGTITVQVPAGATYFVTIHLDYGLKGTTGWNKDSAVATTAVNSTYGSIVNLKSYTFSFAGGTLTSAQTQQTVQSENIFKKNPGIAGLIVNGNSGAAKGNAKVQIYDSKNKLLGAVVTDQDGYYQWLYKYTGKPASFVVKAPDFGQSQAVTLKSNGFLEVNFNVAGQTQGATVIEEAEQTVKLFLPVIQQ